MSGNGAICIQRVVHAVKVDEPSKWIKGCSEEANLSVFGFEVVYEILLITLIFCSVLVRGNVYDGSDIEWKR